jgi:hypothetical protein
MGFVFNGGKCMPISRKKMMAKRKAKEDFYLLNPTICAVCAKIMPYGKGDDHCCSIKCGEKCRQYQTYIRRKTRWLENKESGLQRKILKKYLIEDRGERCEGVGCMVSNTWLGEPIVLTLDHKDGNAGNDLPENLCLLCHNCHSQTETYCGKNRGKGRKSRGLPPQ